MLPQLTSLRDWHSLQTASALCTQVHACRRPVHTLHTRHLRRQVKTTTRHRCCCHATEDSGHQQPFSELKDLNQLQTALNTAIASEDYALAQQLKQRLQQELGDSDLKLADWRAYGLPEWLADRADKLGYRFPTEVQKRAAAAVQQGSDVVVQSETGSGKTLAFVLPLLARLQYPPEVYPDDLKGPQLLIIVPTRELGVQITMLIYRLFGGSINPGIPGERANMFNYAGPRGIKVRGMLSQEEILFAKTQGYLKGVHVLVGLPDCLVELAKQPNAVDVLSHLKALAVDEVDACFQDYQDAMQQLLTDACSHRQKPAMCFVGATVQRELADTAVSMGWMVDPDVVTVGQAGAVPKGLVHRVIKVADAKRKLAVLCWQIRQDLMQQGDDAAPTRVIVFASSEEQAREAAPTIRNVLWGHHKMTVLLPGGEEPIKALHAFRDNTSSLLLATPQAARGLDLPAVSHIYNMDPPDSATEYLHRAGRAGRIGSPVTGVITTLITESQEPSLQHIADDLGVQLQQIQEPSPAITTAQQLEEGAADIDTARKGLEDLYNLF